MRLAESPGLRHTPSGLPVLRLRVIHAQQQQEAGRERTVEIETEVVAYAEAAKRLSQVPVGETLRLFGFLDRKGVKNPALELHVTDFLYP